MISLIVPGKNAHSPTLSLFEANSVSRLLLYYAKRIGSFGAPTDTPTNRASASQCRGCGRCRPVRMSAG